MAGKLDIRVERRDGAHVVAIRGDVDLYSSPEARKVILEQAQCTNEKLIVDLTGVEYMDSSGVATLVEGLQAMEKRGGR